MTSANAHRSGMSRLRSNPIQELRRILRDQYSVSSILKELVQNADDAGAQALHFGTIESWPEGIHPLLTGPTLMVLNDGEFRLLDREGITRLDEGAKGGDSGAIGKYGLGMKSLFHLCEGIFYAASANQPGAEGDPLVSLLNPWEEGGPHDDWSDLDDASRAILEVIRRWEHGCSRWFCLLIPLRDPRHLAGAEAIVQGRVPSLDDVRKSFDLTALVGFTPLLRTVSRFTIWEGDSGTTLSSVARATVRDGARRRAQGSTTLQITPGLANSLCLSATDDASASGTLLRSAGIERLLDDPIFGELKADESWPKNYTLDPRTGRSQQKEKAEPHCAVIVSRDSAGPGGVEITDAVYLPLTDGIREKIPAPLSASYRLLLHGVYFLDAGRRALYKGNDNEDEVQQQWNDSLQRNGVLPLIPLALDQYVATWEIDAADVGEITKALQSSEFFAAYRERVCSEAGWMARIPPDLKRPKWQLAKGSPDYFEFPSLNGREEIARRLFPELRQVCSEEWFVEKNTPRLTSSPPQRWADSPELLCRLLESVESRHLTDADALSFLTEFLQVTGRSLSQGVTELLAKLIREMVSHAGIPALLRVENEFRSLLESAPTQSWVRIGPVEADAQRLFQNLNELNLSVAVIPTSIAPDLQTRPASLLPGEDAEQVLKWLEATADGRPAAQTASMALRVVEATGLPLEAERERYGRYSLWLTRTGSGQDQPLVSWEQLRLLHHKGRLFSGGSALLSALNNALHGDSVYSLYSPSNAKPFETLFGAHLAPNCDSAACIELLCQGPPPRLGTPTSRIGLLEALKSIRSGSTGRQVAAIRYLLHGSHAHAADCQTPLVVTPGNTDGYLARVTEEALQRLDAGWRWVDENLWRCLTQNDLEQYGVTTINVGGVERLLAEAGTDWLADLGLSDAEATNLIVDIQDPTIWWKLPLHSTLRGERVALDPNTAFLDAGYSGSSDIRDVVTIVRAAERSPLRTKYQSRGVREWGPAEAIGVALDQANPASFFRGILDAVHEHERAATSISADHLERLRQTKWLLTRRGDAVAPKDVVVIDGLENYLQNLLARPELEGVFVCLDDLNVQIRQHPALGQLRSRQILPNRRASAEVLALCLAEVPDYHIGQGPEISNTEEGLDLLLRAFTGIDATVLPIVPILRELSEVFRDDRATVAKVVLPHIRKPLSFSLLENCAKALSDGVAGAPATYTQPRLKVLSGYLKSLFAHAKYDPRQFHDFRLPNRLQELMPLKALCVGQQGIDPSYVVHPDLEHVVPSSDATKLDVAATDSDGPQADAPTWDSQVLIQFLRDWEGLVPKRHRGALLALFGDDAKIVNEADALLSPGSVNGARSQLEWSPNSWTNTCESVDKSMARQRFVFAVAQEDSTVQVPNLVGGWFSAPIGGDVESIFVGSLWSTPPEKYRSREFRSRVVTLRKFNPSRISRIQRDAILHESVRLLLKDVYTQQPANLRDWWERLSEGGQLALDIVQEQLLRNAWFYFQQLGDRKLPSLRSLLREHEELSDRRIELRKASTKEAQRQVADIEKALEQLPRKLKDLLVQHAGVRREVLERIRSKMEDYQYSANSVPFELFQNADDASAEFVEMVGRDQATRANKIEFFVLSDHVALRHWGRPINEFARGVISSQKGRERGYDKDLKKMLILGSSDKSEREGLVTGKFGLGFKSVFFLSDQPRVISGDLTFEVLAGFFPHQHSTEFVEGLRGNARGLTEAGDATIVNLPLTPETERQAAAAFAGFVELLPLTLIFSRQVKQCSVEFPDRYVNASLHEGPIRKNGGLEVSVCHASGQELPSALRNERFLVLRTPSGLSLSLNLGPNGARPLPKGTAPGCWVGAPTSGRTDLGFCINGPFEVDVGRNQLADSAGNERIAAELGRELGDALIDLFDAGEDWPRLHGQMSLLPEVDIVSFWQGLWNVLSASSRRIDPVVEPLLWRSGAAIDVLISSRAALPTCLPRPYSGLTTLQAVRGAIEGRLDADFELAHEVLSWPAFQGVWEQGALVSDKTVWSRISGIAGTRPPGSITHLRLADVVAQEVGLLGVVGPEQAEYLGRSITREYLSSWSQSEHEKDELAQLREVLHSLTFQAADGSVGPASDLVAHGLGGDEQRRAAFAPPGRRLAELYSETGLRFFSACREALRADAVELARWARDAETVSTRTAVLDYLLHGDLAHHLAEQLRSDHRESWLIRSPDEYLSAFHEDEQLRVSALLARDRQWFHERLHYFDEPQPEQPLPEVCRYTFFERLVEWWDDEHERQRVVSEYERKAWPSWLPREGLTEGLRSGSPDHWLALLFLGACRSLGQTTAGHHRRFLESAHEQGWWPVFRDPDDTVRWMKILRDWQDCAVETLEHRQWMNLFPAFYQLSRFLEPYRLLLRSAPRRPDGMYRISVLLAPRADSANTGAGNQFDAPPAPLNMGLHWVLRELVRLRVVDANHVLRDCWVPSKQVVGLLSRLGMQAPEGRGSNAEKASTIFEFLRDGLRTDSPHLHYTFDIPLRHVYKRPDLQQRFGLEVR